MLQDKVVIWCGKVLGYESEQGCDNSYLLQSARFLRTTRRVANLPGEEVDCAEEGEKVEKAQNLRRVKDLIERGMNCGMMSAKYCIFEPFNLCLLSS
jgi:hypothetical protein